MTSLDFPLEPTLSLLVEATGRPRDELLAELVSVDKKPLDALLKSIGKSLEKPLVALLKAELEAHATKTVSPRLMAKEVV